MLLFICVFLYNRHIQINEQIERKDRGNKLKESFTFFKILAQGKEKIKIEALREL